MTDGLDELKVFLARIEERVISMDERLKRLDRDTDTKLADHEARLRVLETSLNHLLGKFAAITAIALLIVGIITPIITDLITGAVT